MTYGLKAVCVNNLLINTSTITGVLRQALQLSTASSGTLSYPDLAGRTIYVTYVRNLVGSGSAFVNRSLNFSIDYSSGYPVVTYTPIGSGSNVTLNVYVLIK